MVQYILNSEKVEYFLEFLRDKDSRTIIVGLQQLSFSLENGYIFLPNDKNRVVEELCRIVTYNKEPRVRQWCYMLGSFIVSRKLADICLKKLEIETPKNQSWMVALLSGSLSEEEFLKVRKKAEHYLSKEVINLSTYLFSTDQYDNINSAYVQRIINSNDVFPLLWLGWIASFPNQNLRTRGIRLISEDQMQQLTEFKEDNVLKHIMAAYSQRQSITVDSLGFDVFDYANMEVEHKKWTLTAIWKDKEFIHEHKDYIILLMSRRHLFQLCDKRVREGLANGLSTFDYDSDLEQSVLEWYSNEPEESVRHFLLVYMLNCQNDSDDYYEMLHSVQTHGSEKERLLVSARLHQRVAKSQYISVDFPVSPIIIIKERAMVAKKTLDRYLKKCDAIVSSGDVSAAKELQEEILSALGSDLSSLREGLTNYAPLVIATDGRTGETFTSGGDVDYIKDIKTLRNRLQVELEKVGEQETRKNNNIVNVYGNAADMQIQQGNNDSTQIQESLSLSDADIEKFQSILDLINNHRSQFGEEFGEKSEELIAALDHAQEALEAKNKPMWKNALRVIKDLAIGAGGSLIATGIIALIMPLL